MSFTEDFRKYIKKARKIYNNAPDMTEEATKNALVMPFFVSLGYDVFNPDEFVPEYSCDIPGKKGEKIDYAIMKDGEPVMLIEAKRAGMKLQKQQQGQLFRYFSVSRCRIAVLTNGINYLFFSDINSPNIMDDEPFFSFNILEDDESLYFLSLEQFCRENLNFKNILSKAAFLKYEKVVEKTFLHDIENPSDELVKYFLLQPEIKTGNRITAQMIEKHRESTAKALRKLMGKKITAVSEPVKEIEPELPSATDTVQSEISSGKYPEIENILKKHYGENIKIECQEKPNAYYIEAYENGIKTVRSRVYQREMNPYDIAFFRSDGSTIKLAFFNELSELDNFIDDIKAECAVK